MTRCRNERDSEEQNQNKRGRTTGAARARESAIHVQLELPLEFSMCVRRIMCRESSRFRAMNLLYSEIEVPESNEREPPTRRTRDAARTFTTTPIRNRRRC